MTESEGNESVIEDRKQPVRRKPPSAARRGEEPAIILLVENNPAHAELIRRHLQEHPVANRIFRVPDGEAALDYLLRRGPYADPAESPKPCLTLLDLRLPGMDGLEVLRTIRASDKLNGMPVAVLTSSEAERDVARAYKYNASSYLVKPTDPEQFGRMMTDLGWYWLAWNHYRWR